MRKELRVAASALGFFCVLICLLEHIRVIVSYAEVYEFFVGYTLEIGLCIIGIGWASWIFAETFPEG